MRLDRAAKHLVVADDSAAYRSVLEKVLSDAGYRVSPVSDGEALLEKLTAELPSIDLLVLELNLARVRAIDVLRKVREDPAGRGLPVLVMTDFLSEHLKQVLADLGVEHCVNKYHALRNMLYQVDAILFATDDNQRRSLRRLSNLPVNYWVGEDLHLQYCFDLSADGMFIIVTEDAPPPVGTRLALRFWLPSSDKLVATPANVVWLNTPGEGLRISHPPGMGVRFVDLDPEDRRLIEGFVASL